MNKCLTSRIKIHLTLSNGYPTILSLAFVIFHQRALRWRLHSLGTQLLFKKCSKELLNNSLQCSEEKHSYIGTLEKEWMRWNSQRLKAI